MIKYGLITDTDARTLEKTLDLILNYRNTVFITEIGVYSGETGNGMCEYVRSKGGKALITGVDNKADGQEMRFVYDRMIIGNSFEVYNKIEDNSQDLIFVDGNHSFPIVIADFFCYAKKVRIGGFIAFHDTGAHIKPFTDYQKVGSEGDPDMYISVRMALQLIGLFGDAGYDEEAIRKGMRYKGGHGFRMIFDEADPVNAAGGICVFQKTWNEN